MGSEFHWDWHFIGQSLPYLLGGLWTTIYVCVLAALLMFPISLIAAAGRMSAAWPICALASIYVNLFRSTPFLGQLVWIFFALPMLVHVEFSPVQAAVLGLALYIASYQAEVV